MGKNTEVHGTPSVRQLSTWDADHMTGARSGLIHAMLYVRAEILRHDPDVRRIPKHHTAKRRAAMAKVEALRAAERVISDKQIECGIVLRGHRALVAGRAALNPVEGEG